MLNSTHSFWFQISTLPTEDHPHGFIVSDAEDLLTLFDADYGVLVIGDGAKILGLSEQGREILVIAQYLRLKGFTSVFLYFKFEAWVSN